MQKFVPVLEENLSVNNAQRFSAKYLKDKTFKQMQNQTNAKHFINSEEIFKSTKYVLEKRSTKRAPVKLPHLKV